jgi:hypothetical protein
VIDIKCDDFEEGLLHHGLIDAMTKFVMRSLDVYNGILSGTLTAQDANAKLISLDRLMFQIDSVILSNRPQISNEILNVASMNSTVLQPIELMAALVLAIYIYFWIYKPFMCRLHTVTCNLNATLMLLWSVTEGSGANTQDADSGKKSPTISANKSPNIVATKIIDAPEYPAIAVTSTDLIETSAEDLVDVVEQKDVNDEKQV